MASTAHRRTMHLLMLTGSGLVSAGIWVRVLTVAVNVQVLLREVV